jgi:SAM-dependent methyltransferase
LFEVISKADLFGWVDAGVPFDPKLGLKDIQDTFILSELRNASAQRILEFGGGNTRVLPQLSRRNECWNYDTFDGRDNGPSWVPRIRRVKVVVGRMGEFSETVPSGYFDVVFSISVLEHITAPQLVEVFRDCARILRPGGTTMHAIDVYMLDALQPDHPHNVYVRRTLDAYRQAAGEAGLLLAEPTRLLQSHYFSSAYASNPDETMMGWNRVVPSLSDLRKAAQSVSLKAIWRKP